jgi:hypothetical protein
MLISHQEPKLVFIHVQKTGGVSISDLLGRFVPTSPRGAWQAHGREARSEAGRESGRLLQVRFCS